MTPRRAFWEAFVTVCIPSLATWTILAYVLRSKANITYEEAWPIYLILFLLPLPLMFPIYARYRKCIQYGAQNRTRRYHVTWAILIAILGGAYLVDAIHRNGWDKLFHLALGSSWLLVGVDQFRRWMRTRHTLPTSGAKE